MTGTEAAKVLYDLAKRCPALAINPAVIAALKNYGDEMIENALESLERYAGKEKQQTINRRSDNLR